MKKTWIPLTFACLLIGGIIGCKKDAKTSNAPTNEISAETLLQIQHLGFSTKTVQKVEEGYMVEGDIVLTDELLNGSPEYRLLRIGSEEQYRTTNLVTKLPRTISILVSNLGTA